MWRGQLTAMSAALGILLAGVGAARAADSEIDKLLQGPVGKDWVTNGGNLTNQRYSTLKQIDTGNVSQLKGAWMTHLKGSGVGGKYSLEATPLVKDGMMYIVTGNDDVFALNAKTGEILWERRSGIDQKLTSVCCGWDNRGLAMGDGVLFLGQLDANVVALDIRTGKELWKTPIEVWQNGYGITSAPLYYDGIVYSGITGGEYGIRGRLTALDAKTGKILWRFYTLPGPNDVGGNTWPAGSDAYQHGGGAIWNTPAVDPQLGLIYFSVGNCGPDYDGSQRAGDNLFCASVVALHAKTGEYAWHFQEVHHDIWDYDAASPSLLFDTTVNGQPRKAIAQAGRTGWVYILDRTNGKPLVGIEERAVPQEPRQKTAKTQPYPIGDATVPQCAQPLDGYEKVGCIFEIFLGGADLGAAFGRRRHELVADVLQSGHWVPLRSWHRPHQRVCALRRQIQEGTAIQRRNAGGTNRFGNERHLDCHRRQHRQDRLAEESAIPGRQRWRIDHDRRRLGVSR